jgi:hypothetical protein
LKFFLDTEFIERGLQHPIQLISIGIVSESGDEYYAVSSEYDPATASEWVRVNVLSKITQDTPRPVDQIAREVRDWVTLEAQRGATLFDPEIEFVGYYSDYDCTGL